jgi:adenylylsulfate kinase
MENIYPVYDQLISREEKEAFLNQKAKVFWLTGLSGSGKTTIAKQVERILFNQGFFVQLIDGDNVRSGLCNNLTFSLEDRKENIRRIAELTSLSLRQGIICINTFVSPTIEIRNMAKEIVGVKDFFEILIDTPLEECENRDVKGLYKKARAGEIKGFTGIDSPFEKPINPSLIVSTNQSIQESAAQLTSFILKHVKAS